MDNQPPGFGNYSGVRQAALQLGVRYFEIDSVLIDIDRDHIAVADHGHWAGHAAFQLHFCNH